MAGELILMKRFCYLSLQQQLQVNVLTIFTNQVIYMYPPVPSKTKNVGISLIILSSLSKPKIAN